MIVELLSVAVVFVGGCLLVRSLGLTGWPLPAFGLVAGICLQLAVGLVQVATPLPTSPALTLALTGGLPAAWWLVRWRQGHDVSVRVGHAVAYLAALAVAVGVCRVANLVKWHTDSFRYLMSGSLLADGTYYTAVSTENATKRLIGVSLLHAPANLNGEYYLRSITPLLAITTVTILVWFYRQGMRDRLDSTQVAIFATLGVLLLVSNNRFVFSAFYINGHLLVAVLMLVIAGCGWLLLLGYHRRSGAPGDAPARALTTLPLLAIPALVIARPEGMAMAGLALLPVLLSERVPVRHRSAALGVLGASTLVWQGFLVWLHWERDSDLTLSVAGPLVLGVGLVLGAGLLRWLPRLPRTTRLLWVFEAGLWLALAALTVRQPGILVDSVQATVQNLVYGAGKWGTTLVVLAALVVGALILLRAPEQASLRFPVTAFIPLGYLLAYLREAGAYREGYGDSLTRMFMHIFPLAVLYLIFAVSAGHLAPRWTRRRSRATLEGAG